MHILRIIVYILTVIGAINWGLVGLMNLDLVALIFGEMTIAAKVTYTIIGISAILLLILTFRYIFLDD